MTDYKLLENRIRELAKDDQSWLPLFANASALLMEAIPGINRAGFYIRDTKGLYLGPFQGKPACPRIEIGKGVCGTAVEKGLVLCIPNVHEFNGHIACDPTTDSEIVLPLHYAGRIVAVLDIDSPILKRLSLADQEGLKSFALTLERCADLSPLADALPAEPKKAGSEPGMPFELWLFAVKRLAQTYEMVEPIYNQLSEVEKKALRREYEQSY